MSAEWWQMNGREIASAVRERAASAREVIEAHLQRIASVDDELNAVAVVLADQALSAADEIDRRIGVGEQVGPLSGVPVTVKENVDVAGSATTLGITPLRDAVATHDAPHIAQLRAAGTVVVGRTNMPEFGMRWHTDN
jgi:amidase